MSISISLPPETESALRARAAQHGQSVEDYLSHLAINWAGVNGMPLATGARQELSIDEWVAQFRAWAASHKPLPIIADDSRESIYAGRGE